MTLIDLPEALDLLRQARDERGADYLYSDHFPGACVYAAGGDAPTPACLVGVALHRAGVPVDTLAGLTGRIEEVAGLTVRPVAGFDNGVADYVALDLVYNDESALSGVTLTEPAVRVLLAAQRQQDAGHTWGGAVAFAERVAAALMVASV